MIFVCDLVLVICNLPRYKKMKNNQKLKIAVAMSGGVDSSVAAKILKDEGHSVTGLFLRLWSDPLCQINRENRCCNYEALEDARKVAAKFKIPFYVINARDEFKKEVVDYFLHEYKNLCTPNPCVVCNDKIKFGLLLRKAMEIGCEKLATGHYVRIQQSQTSNPSTSSGQALKPQTCNLKLKNSSGRHCEEQSDEAISKDRLPRPKGLAMTDSNITIQQFNNNDAKNSDGQEVYHLLTGIDKSKDQSYMLYHLNQEQLSQVMFPLGEMTKVKVRKLAKKWDLPVKEKPESQEICFFGDKDYRIFLKRYLPQKYFKSGEIVDRNGHVLGEHFGLINYTIGQRKGIEQISNIKFQISNEMSKSQNVIVRKTICRLTKQSKKCLSGDKRPLYVMGFNIKNNRLIVGEDKEVYSKEMTVTDVNWIDPEDVIKLMKLMKLMKLKAKIRYRHEAVACKIKNKIVKIKNIEVLFDKPQRAITPGQSAVFYLGDEVLGGGIIR